MKDEFEGERLATEFAEEVVVERPSEGGPPPPEAVRLDCTIRAGERTDTRRVSAGLDIL